jgi:hypothetical protein
VNQTLLVPTVLLVASVGVLLVTALVRRSVASRVRAAVATGMPATAVATGMPATAVVRPSRVCRRREQEKQSKGRSD